MNNRQYPIHLSIASSTEIEQMARQLKTTHEEFLITGIPAQHSTRPMLLGSWRRCSAMQVSPLLRNAPLAIIHEDQLRRLRAAHPVMKRLSVTAAPIRHPLSDEMPGTLDVTGNYHLIRPFLSSFIAAANPEGK